MASIKQEMPPPGGYGPVDMAKKIGKKSPYFWSNEIIFYLLFVSVFGIFLIVLQLNSCRKFDLEDIL